MVIAILGILVLTAAPSFQTTG
ncbi:hypothetical protein [Vibrio splendidus]